MNSLGDRIKKMRGLISLNQTEFGKLIGLTSGAMSSIEKGTRMPPVEALLAICKIAMENDIDIAWLLFGLEKTSDADQVVELRHAFNSLSPTGRMAALHQVASLKELFPEMPTANEDGVYIM